MAAVFVNQYPKYAGTETFEEDPLWYNDSPLGAETVNVYALCVLSANTLLPIGAPAGSVPEPVIIVGTALLFTHAVVAMSTVSDDNGGG